VPPPGFACTPQSELKKTLEIVSEKEKLIIKKDALLSLKESQAV
jgi:hypothetical protein